MKPTSWHDYTPLNNGRPFYILSPLLSPFLCTASFHKVRVGVLGLKLGLGLGLWLGLKLGKGFRV